MAKAYQKGGTAVLSDIENAPAYAARYRLNVTQYRPGGRSFSKPVYFATVDNLGRLVVPLPVYAKRFPLYCRPVDYPAQDIALRHYQREALDGLAADRFGILLGGAGSGKTVVATALFQRLGLRVLVLVGTIDLAKQWRARCKQFLGIDAGVLSGGNRSEGRQVTIATMQTALKNPGDILQKVDVIFVDECHHVPCTTLRDILNASTAAYRYGCTATPKRSDGLTKAMDWLLGGVTATMDPGRYILPVTVLRLESGIKYAQADHNEATNAICADDKRNALLTRTICNLHGCVMGLSLRVGHLHEIAKRLEKLGRVARVVTGSTPKKERQAIIEGVTAGAIPIMLATYQLAAEGLDIPRLDTLVMLSPVGNDTQIEQACGRIARPFEGKQPPLVIDVIDKGKPAYWARKRVKVYSRIGAKYAKPEIF